MLDPSLLRLLALINETGSLAGAADLLGITPAGVTQQVARLERAVGGPLVRRGPRGASMEPLGRIVLEHAQRIQAATVQADRALGQAMGRMGRTLRVGAFPTAAFHLVAPALTALRHRHDELDLDVLEIESVNGPELVAADRIDVAIVSEFDEPATLPSVVESHLVLLDPLVVVLPNTHPAARRSTPDQPIPLRQLADDPWVAILAGEAARRQFDRLIRQSGTNPEIRFETASYDVAQALVGAGVAVTVVSRLALRDVPGTVTRPLLGERAARRITAITLAHRPFTPLVDEFLALLANVAGAQARTGPAVRS